MARIPAVDPTFFDYETLRLRQMTAEQKLRTLDALRRAAWTIWIAPPEYVVVFKLEFHRQGGSEKHLDDIARMLRVSGDRISESEIATWVRRMKLEGEWDRVQERVRQLRAGPP